MTMWTGFDLDAAVVIGLDDSREVPVIREIRPQGLYAGRRKNSGYSTGERRRDDL
jgi:hypothetical protein